MIHLKRHCQWYVSADSFGVMDFRCLKDHFSENFPLNINNISIGYRKRKDVSSEIRENGYQQFTGKRLFTNQQICILGKF